MSRVYGRFARLSVWACIVGAGILPGTCAMQLRTAVIDSTTGFAGDLVAALLNALLPLEAIG